MTNPDVPNLLLGYGRYRDQAIRCPRAKSRMTPCVARDGRLAMADETCVGCDAFPSDLLVSLVRAATESPITTKD